MTATEVSGEGFNQDNAAQTDSLKKRRNLCYAAGLGGTALVHAGLWQLWYKDYPSSGFHFFNDNREWFQMDKAGHVYSAYYLGVVGIEAAKWAGVEPSKQWRWALFGSIFQHPIEIWDGFSAGWGASLGDLTANTLGTVLAAGQHALWKEQKITVKYSYAPTVYASMRPNTLGSNLPERMLKDYNGQTYWLSFSPFSGKNTGWISLAAGTGADGMLGGVSNVWTDKNGNVYDRSDVVRRRQYYLSPDINLTRLPVKNKNLKRVLFVLNCIKFPFPALEMSQNRFKWHWINP